MPPVDVSDWLTYLFILGHFNLPGLVVPHFYKPPDRSLSFLWYSLSFGLAQMQYNVYSVHSGRILIYCRGCEVMPLHSEGVTNKLNDDERSRLSQDKLNQNFHGFQCPVSAPLMQEANAFVHCTIFRAVLAATVHSIAGREFSRVP